MYKRTDRSTNASNSLHIEDYFAGIALKALLQSSDYLCATLAEQAYEIAGAMCAERERRMDAQCS